AEPDTVEHRPYFQRIRVDGTWTGTNLLTFCPSASPVALMPERIRPALEAMGLHHIASLPLHVRARPTGCLNLSRSTDRPFSERELRVGEILADLLVVHFENARLFAEATTRLDDMRNLLEFARTVTASLALDERLQASVEVLARMVDASNAFFLLLEAD